MSSSTFTPSTVIDMSKEREWPANLGMLDWDQTNIVFTKRTLIEFLKYTGTTVDTNFSNISKLPRYAKFGKMSASSGEAPVAQAAQATPAAAAAPAPAPASAPAPVATATSDFKPSRRVRTVPGGPHSDIFGVDAEDDALSTAPPKEKEPEAVPETTEPAAASVVDNNGLELKVSPDFKPSRRVRTNPGGNSSLGNFWDSEETEQFKPTRRVRQIPGGQDHINGIF